MTEDDRGGVMVGFIGVLKFWGCRIGFKMLEEFIYPGALPHHKGTTATFHVHDRCGKTGRKTNYPFGSAEDQRRAAFCHILSTYFPFKTCQNQPFNSLRPAAKILVFSCFFVVAVTCECINRHTGRIR